MKLYRFRLNKWKDQYEVTRDEFDAEEKPKTYTYMKVGYWKTRISKSYVERVIDDYGNICVYLLNDDIKLAARMMMDYKREELRKKNEQHENTVKDMLDAIEILTNIGGGECH